MSVPVQISGEVQNNKSRAENWLPYHQSNLHSFLAFDWNLVFKWEFLPNEVRSQRIKDPIGPLRSPVIAGNLT